MIYSFFFCFFNINFCEECFVQSNLIPKGTKLSYLTFEFPALNSKNKKKTPKYYTFIFHSFRRITIIRFTFYLFFFLSQFHQKKIIFINETATLVTLLNPFLFFIHLLRFECWNHLNFARIWYDTIWYDMMCKNHVKSIVNILKLFMCTSFSIRFRELNYLWIIITNGNLNIDQNNFSVNVCWCAIEIEYSEQKHYTHIKWWMKWK